MINQEAKKQKRVALWETCAVLLVCLLEQHHLIASACKPLPEGDSFRDAEVPWERHIKRHFVVLADTCL
jgi:hypothetical protein